jgi:hypothetical protein
LAEIFGDGGGEGGLSVIDVTDGTDWIVDFLPLQWVFERSNLAKEWVSLCVRLKVRVR